MKYRNIKTTCMLQLDEVSLTLILMTTATLELYLISSGISVASEKSGHRNLDGEL